MGTWAGADEVLDVALDDRRIERVGADVVQLDAGPLGGEPGAGAGGFAGEVVVRVTGNRNALT
jgi:hypothetical protein